MSFKAHFSRFLDADPARLHVAAHSHHLWPDVTFEAQAQCWLDAARLTDSKWEWIFSEAIPAAQRHVAAVLRLPDPSTITFGPNTHAFLNRLLSCLPTGRTPRVLTTQSEFHSATRQLRRIEEDGLAKVTWIAVEPLADFSARFADAAARGGHDLIYVSQVFFDSGFVVAELAALTAAVPDPETLVVIDGYHGFLAVPTDLSAISDRVFYLAGGYKYAMAGEGVAFLHAPPGYSPRPRDTGWYAAFEALTEGENRRVGYRSDASRFLGATFDPVGLYRFNAVMNWLDRIELTVEEIHAHVHRLQQGFIDGLASERLNPAQLVVPIEDPRRGNFLTFRNPAAGDIYDRLLACNVVADFRGDRLRFGFGIYHDDDDITRLIDTIERVLEWRG